MAAARRPARSEAAKSRFFLADGDATDRVLDRVVVDRQAARAGVTLQRRPALERMIESLGRAAAGRHGSLVHQALSV